MSDFWSDREYPVEQPRHLSIRAASGVVNERYERRGKTKVNEDQEIKLRDALAVIPTKVQEKLGVKEFKVLTVATDEERRVTRYPFLGIYIEACLQPDSTTRESEMRDTIEKAICEKLSCTCSPEMSGCQKAVYRVDFEMKCIG